MSPQVEIIDMGKKGDSKKSSSPPFLEFVGENKFIIVSGVLAALLFFLGIAVLLIENKQANEKVQIIPAENSASISGVYVDLSGAVERPGLYYLPGNSRVNDLLVAAGGLSAGADRDWVSKSINLAQKVTDGIKIYIPKKTESFQGGVKELNSGGVAGAYNQKININLAVQAELETLPGIGPSTAKKIVDYRNVNGFFTTVENIKDVSGIGDKMFDQLKDLISVY
jgi:competence protein ComEA